MSKIQWSDERIRNMKTFKELFAYYKYLKSDEFIKKGPTVMLQQQLIFSEQTEDYEFCVKIKTELDKR